MHYTTATTLDTSRDLCFASLALSTPLFLFQGGRLIWTEDSAINIKKQALGLILARLFNLRDVFATCSNYYFLFFYLDTVLSLFSTLKH